MEFPLGRFLVTFEKSTGISVRSGDISITRLKSKKNVTVRVDLHHDGATSMLDIPPVFVVKYLPGERSDAYLNLEFLGASDESTLEHHVLEECISAGLRVPRVILVNLPFLMLQFIPGKNLCDLLNDGKVPMDEKEEMMESLGDWIAKFHATSMINGLQCSRGDANLRNFIVNGDGEITGVDFEETRPGNLMKDLYEVIDSVLITSPGIFDQLSIEPVRWKFQLCNLFLEQYFTSSGSNAIAASRDLALFIQNLVAIMGQHALRRGMLPEFLQREPYVKEMLVYELKSVFIIP